MTALVIGSHLACTADPALFQSTDVVDHQAAKALCRVCPQAFLCADVTDHAVKNGLSLVGTQAGRRFGGVS